MFDGQGWVDACGANSARTDRLRERIDKMEETIRKISETIQELQDKTNYLWELFGVKE